MFVLKKTISFYQILCYWLNKIDFNIFNNYDECLLSLLNLYEKVCF
jgi:hypothetical protein